MPGIRSKARPVSSLSAVIQHAALRRTTALRAERFVRSAHVMLSRSSEDLVNWCGWHGMQGVRGLNPLSSTTGQAIIRPPFGVGSD